MNKLVLLAFIVVVPYASADLVTLNSGETFQGDIISETDTQITIQVSNATRTITTTRLILKADIKSIGRESPEQKQERRAHEALDQLQLNPNSEFSVPEYERVIEAFNKYLTTYPESKFADDIRQRLSLWTNELSHVERGEVKFNSRWMTPEEKKPLVDKFLQMQRVQTAWAEVQALTKTLNDFENQRNQLTASIANTGQAIANYQNVLNNPPRIAIATPTTIQGRPPQYDSRGRMVQTGSPDQRGPNRVHYVTDVQAVNNAQQNLPASQAQLSQMQQQLADVNGSIGSTRQGLARAEEAYRIAYAKAQEPLPLPPRKVLPAPPVVVTQQVVAAPAPPPPPPPPPSWIETNWKWLVGGVAALMIVVIYAVRRHTTQRVSQQLMEEEERLRDENLARRREKEPEFDEHEQGANPRES